MIIFNIFTYSPTNYPDMNKSKCFYMFDLRWSLGVCSSLHSLVVYLASGRMVLLIACPYVRVKFFR